MARMDAMAKSLSDNHDKIKQLEQHVKRVVAQLDCMQCSRRTSFRVIVRNK